jgi:PTH1 family peptidyl-tRNA hydrolase
VRLIAGLGNPGRRYAESRHNIGYRVVDELARRAHIDVARYEGRFQGLLGECQLGDERIVLLKPTTYMNLSGQSVSAVWRFFKLELAGLLIVFDDIDLPVGRIRLRPQGSAGGHRGLSDVIRHFGSEDFARLRIGIGKVRRSATVEYVLSRFEPEEREPIEAAVGRAADAIRCWIEKGIDAAMNEFNAS